MTAFLPLLLLPVTMHHACMHARTAYRRFMLPYQLREGIANATTS